VKISRVWVWFALNLVFTISGILHLVLQRESSRPVVIDTAAVALTTDVSHLLEDAKIGKALKWKSMSYLTKKDAFGENPNDLQARERILLKLDRRDDGFVLAKK
jgi:hypothetical protein